MDNLSVIKALIGSNYPFDEDVFRAGLIYSGIDPCDVYSSSRDTDIGFANFILFLTTTAKRVSEGGYTVEIDIEALFRVRSILLGRWGIPDGEGATLRDRSYLW